MALYSMLYVISSGCLSDSFAIKALKLVKKTSLPVGSISPLTWRKT